MNSKIQAHLAKFKSDVRSKIIDLGFGGHSQTNELIEYITEYERLVLEKDDFVKRKRVQNEIPISNRCNAKRASGEQCTRRRRNDCDFCGTHYKGTPHGLVCDAAGNDEERHSHKHEVVATDIMGIVYYIDKYNNVYRTEDILQGVNNPKIIAKCVHHGNQYTIPEFGLV